jgi:hypothetical protein
LEGKSVVDYVLPLLTDQEVIEFLKPISSSGFRVYKILFENFEPQHSSMLKGDDFRKAKQLLGEYLQEPRRISIEVHPNYKILFPWAILFNRALTTNHSRNDFVVSCLGLRHLIEERFDWCMGLKKCFEGPKRNVVAAICPNADTLKWHANENHPLMARRDKDVINIFNRLPPFQEELRNTDADVIYFFGHAQIAPGNISDMNWLDLAGEQLTAQTLDSPGAISYRRHTVLAFLNGCQTVPLRYITPVSVIGQFTQKHDHFRKVRCVATSHRLPTRFAIEFARDFWEQFLPSKAGGLGQTLGSSLYHAKQHMLQAYNNPLGLLYSLFGDSDLRYRECPGLPTD